MESTDRAALVAELVDRYAMADRFGAVSRTRQLVAAGVDAAVLAEVVGDAQRHVGALWQSDAWTIAQEHAATSIAESVLATLDELRPPETGRGRIAMVAADGEWHVLPARLAGRAFEHAGVRVRFLGGSVPPEDLVRALPSADLDAVAVSVTLSRNLPGAARTIAAAHAVGLPVSIGGQAVDAGRAARLGADLYAARAADAVAGVLEWVQAAAPVPLARPQLATRPATALREARRTLEAAALEQLRRTTPELDEGPDTEVDRLAEDLEAHLAYLEAALLLEDPQVYREAVTWLGDVLEARGTAASLTLELDALEQVLVDHPAALAAVRGVRA